MSWRRRKDRSLKGKRGKGENNDNKIKSFGSGNSPIRLQNSQKEDHEMSKTRLRIALAVPITGQHQVTQLNTHNVHHNHRHDAQQR